MTAYNIEVLIKKQLRIDATDRASAFEEGKFVCDVLREEYGDHVDISFTIEAVISPDSIRELKLESARLINKINWGLFTTQDDARAAQQRLNELNVIIGNHKELPNG